MKGYINAILAAAALSLNITWFFRSGDGIYLVFAAISFTLIIFTLPN